MQRQPHLRLGPDASLQKDDSTKAIKELKDGNTGLPFNMEYSAIAAFVDLLKDPNAIDDRKMLVSIPSSSVIAAPQANHNIFPHSWSRCSHNFHASQRESSRRGWNTALLNYVRHTFHSGHSYFPGPDLCFSVYVRQVTCDFCPELTLT